MDPLPGLCASLAASLAPPSLPPLPPPSQALLSRASQNDASTEHHAAEAPDSALEEQKLAALYQGERHHPLCAAKTTIPTFFQDSL
eukprot:1357826-Rhodomonas_salina.2